MHASPRVTKSQVAGGEGEKSERTAVDVADAEAVVEAVRLAVVVADVAVPEAVDVAEVVAVAVPDALPVLVCVVAVADAVDVCVVVAVAAHVLHVRGHRSETSCPLNTTPHSPARAWQAGSSTRPLHARGPADVVAVDVRVDVAVVDGRQPRS